MQKKFALFNEVIEIFGDAGLLDAFINSFNNKQARKNNNL